MSRLSSAALLPPLLLLMMLLSCGNAEPEPEPEPEPAPEPFFGLLNLLTSTSSSNGTGLLASLVQSHIQHKINTLQTLEDLLTIAANITGSGLSSLG